MNVQYHREVFVVEGELNREKDTRVAIACLLLYEWSDPRHRINY